MNLPFWAKPKFVFLIVLLYLAIHFTIRMVMPPGPMSSAWQSWTWRPIDFLTANTAGILSA